VLHALDPGLIAHCLAAHLGTAKGHARLLEVLGKRPLIDLDIAEEEGVGGATALALVRLACEVR
jgi:nicotinate-nucleotide--dimethylbenzimidazole phosphoribosyltransferase